MAAGRPDAQQDPDLTVIAHPGLRPIGFVINLTARRWRSSVRQALNLAVPVDRSPVRSSLATPGPDSPLAFNTDWLRHRRPSWCTTGQGESPAGGRLEAGFHCATSRCELTMFVLAEGLFPGDCRGEIVANALTQVGVKSKITQDRGRRLIGTRSARIRRISNGTSRCSASIPRTRPACITAVAVQVEHRRRRAARCLEFRAATQPEVDRLLAESGAEPDAASARCRLAEAQELIWNDTRIFGCRSMRTSPPCEDR